VDVVLAFRCCRRCVRRGTARKSAARFISWEYISTHRSCDERTCAEGALDAFLAYLGSTPHKAWLQPLELLGATPHQQASAAIRPLRTQANLSTQRLTLRLRVCRLLIIRRNTNCRPLAVWTADFPSARAYRRYVRTCTALWFCPPLSCFRDNVAVA